jgi:hypothetical protein
MLSWIQIEAVYMSSISVLMSSMELIDLSARYSRWIILKIEEI